MRPLSRQQNPWLPWWPRSAAGATEISPDPVTLPIVSVTPSLTINLNPDPVAFRVRVTGDDYEATILADAPVAYYRLGEAAGLAQDSSGNGNHTTVNAGGTKDIGGAIRDDDGAVFADGTSFTWQAPDDPTLDFGDQFSFEGWISIDPSAANGNHTVIAKGDLFTPTSPYLQVNVSTVGGVKAGTIILWVESTSQITGGSRTLQVGRWYHVVATKDGATRKMYIDGVDVSTGGLGNVTATDNNVVLALGEDSGGSTTWHGRLDELAVYDYALSAAQVAEHYAQGVGHVLEIELNPTPVTVPIATTVPVAEIEVNPAPVTMRIRVTGDAYDAMVLADGAVGYWRLGEPSGNALDSAGSNDGLVQGDAPTRDAAGLVADDDGAIDFQGVEAANPPYVQITPVDGALDVGDVFSFEAWLRPRDLSALMTLWYVDDDVAPLIRIATDGSVRVTHQISGDTPMRSSVGSIVAGERYHVVVTKDGATRHIYINGVEDTVLGTDQTFLDGTGLDRYIGARFSVVQPFKGTLDEVALYDYALTAAQVLEHYREGTGHLLEIDLNASPVTVPITPVAPSVAGEASPDPQPIPITVTTPLLELEINPDPVTVPIGATVPVVEIEINPAPATIPLLPVDVSTTSGPTPTPVAIPLNVPAPTLEIELNPTPVVVPLVVPDVDVQTGKLINADPVGMPLVVPVPLLEIDLNPDPVEVPLVVPPPVVEVITGEEAEEEEFDLTVGRGRYRSPVERRPRTWRRHTVPFRICAIPARAITWTDAAALRGDTGLSASIAAALGGAKARAASTLALGAGRATAASYAAVRAPGVDDAALAVPLRGRPARLRSGARIRARAAAVGLGDVRVPALDDDLFAAALLGLPMDGDAAEEVALLR